MLLDFIQTIEDAVELKTVPGGGGGDSNIKKVGMLVENFKIDP